MSTKPASAGNITPSLISDSASSAAGSESRTIPQPAQERASRSRSRAQRRATQNSPSPVASVQPSVPAYQPRSKPSRAGIELTAAAPEPVLGQLGTDRRRQMLD